MNPPSAEASDRTASRCTGDDGASLVEYALLLALIVVACIGAVTFFGNTLDQDITSSTSELFVP